MPSKLNLEELRWLSIAALHAKLAAREFTCVELTKAFAERLESTGPKYNALAHSLGHRAVKKAKDIDRELKRGRTRSALQGVPYGAKDLLSYAGEPTEWGAKPYAGQVFPDHAAAIAKLEKAGGLCIGKLAMVELAGGGGYRYPAASASGPGLNPWDVTRWAGGSSSGSAACVAAGLVPYALGSETRGSILTPAAYCGVTGLRPTYGLVSRRGAMALSWTLDKIGPIARSAVDCAAVLQGIAGGDSEDPGSAGKSFFHSTEYIRPNKELRVGVATKDLYGLADLEVRKVFAEAIETFRRMGFQLVEVSLPELPYSAATTTIIGCEASSIFEELVTSGKVDQLADANQIAGLRASFDYSARDYLKAMRVRTLVQEALGTMLADVDFLLAPSVPSVATKITESVSRPADVATGDRGLRDLVAAGNLAGLPALSVPCGFVGGLPLGMSIVARPFSENLVLAVGQRYQEQTDWHQRRPERK